MAAAARESPQWTKVIKQQDNDGDLRGPTANGLTRRFLRGQHAHRCERKVERQRARFINLIVRATRTQMRCDSENSAQLSSARLDATQGDATGPGASRGIIYLIHNAQRVYLSSSTNGTREDSNTRLEYFLRIYIYNAAK